MALPAIILALIFIPRWLPAVRLTGFLWALLLAAPPSALPVELEGAELWIEGWIATIPDRESRSIRFEFETARAQNGEQAVPFSGRLRLSWWDDGERAAHSPAARTELRGRRPLGILMRLKRP